MRGSINMVNFTSAVSHVSSTAGPAGYDLHTFRLNASDGLCGRGFIQVGATHP
ncbi:hypothetical protein [Luteolibacter soli]